jgi:hypothetical protein
MKPLWKWKIKFHNYLINNIVQPKMQSRLGVAY